ncbi:mucin-20 [Pteropus vampyrus]|uniref:Mucin-20 n=1 Tax=Pteropus vampyrus TaxID=132908 RepID=A0A6P3RLI1_PTEVA|nr:mucin-20 [Pteropus vampyrus]
MGSLWGLTLTLYFCYWQAAAPGSSEGPTTPGRGPLVTVSHTEVPTVTLRVDINSEGTSQIPDLAETSVPSHIPLETQTLSTQTSDRNLIPVSTISEAVTRETKTIFPATETRALTKITPSKFMVVITSFMETSATSGSPSGTGMTTVETIIRSDLSEAFFDTLCTDDGSEKTKRITIDTLTLAHTSAEARALALESNSVPAIIISQTLSPDITSPSKVLVANAGTDIEVISCGVTEIETIAINPGASDIDHSPTGGKTLSTPDMSALPDFTEAKSYLAGTTTSSETLSTAGTTELATPDTIVETLLSSNSTTERETSAAKATTSSGTLVTINMNPLEETSALSVEITRHTEVSGAVTISIEAGSTVGQATSPAGSSATVYSLSEVANTKNSTSLEISTTDSTTSGTVLTSRSALSSIHLTVANNSQETEVILAKMTASAKTPKTASTAGGKPPTTILTTAGTTWATETTAGGDGGFLLLRLSVASPEDLTDPRVAEKLMRHLRHELHTLMPLIQVSLLRVKRD